MQHHIQSIPEMMPSDVTSVCQEQCGIQSKEQFTTSSSSLVTGNSAAEHVSYSGIIHHQGGGGEIPVICMPID